MIGRLIGGVVNLARPIEYSVQTGWIISVSFEWLLLLTGFGATESGVDCHILYIIIVALTLMFVASGLPLPFRASEVPGSLVLLPLWARQQSSPAQKRVISAVRAAMDFGFSWPRCRASPHHGCYV